MDGDSDFDEPIDSTLAVGDFVYDENALTHQQQEMLKVSRPKDYLPDVIRNFILHFQQCFHGDSVFDLYNCYDSSFHKLTEKFYKNSPWPDPDQVVAPLVQNDAVFLMFYSELYYRHLYSKGNPTLEQRVASYNNYCSLFNLILNSTSPASIELPFQWSWEIIEEFIYQFNAFAIYRNKAIKKLTSGEHASTPASKEEIAQLKLHRDSWSAYAVLNVLYTLCSKAHIVEQLKAIRNGEDPALVAGEYGILPLYNTLGYFSIIGLLTVHTLLGDFSRALRTMHDVELNKKAALFTKVPNAHATTFYYVGFSQMMVKRYADAIKSFSHILVYIHRSKSTSSRSAQFDVVNKKSEQMYALLAICIVLCPTRIDDMLLSNLKEKYGEQIAKMQKGDWKTFEELFLFACPKFITPSVPDFEHHVLNSDPVQHHLRIFMTDVRNAALAPSLKSYLNLYAAMDLSKLASFLETDVEGLRAALVAFKLKSIQIKSNTDSLLDGIPVNLSEVDISLEKDLIHISEQKNFRKFGDWFMRNIQKNYTLQDQITNPRPSKRYGGNAEQRKDNSGANSSKAAAAGATANA